MHTSVDKIELSETQTTDAILRRFTWVAVVVASFMLMRPYGGIVHDNVLYLAQALLRLSPEIYGGDAFFQWGSQDRYTLFSPIYASLIVQLGVGNSTVMLLLLAQAVFLAGSFTLVRALVPPELRGFSMLFIVCSVGLYGSFFLFRMAEPFVTPRGFVEAITLFAIALLAASRGGWALILLLAGALLHPLMALAGLIYWWVYKLLEDRRWWWFLGLGVIPAALALAGIAPFTQLFQTFDKQWLSILIQENANVFLTRWSRNDWAMVAFDAAVLFIGMQISAGVAQRAFKAALVTAALTLGATFVFADILHNVLVTSIQPWRALWIVHWMAAAAIPFVVSRLWNQGSLAQLAAGLLVFAFATRGLPTSVASAVIALTLYHYRSRAAVNPSLVRIGLCLLLAGAFINWISILSRVQLYSSFDAVNPIADFVIRAFSKTFPMLVFATAVVWFSVLRRRFMPVASIVAFIFLMLGISFWDQRSPFRVYIETAELGSHSFSRIVQPHQQVLWHGNAAAPWIMMQRKSYFSDTQRAGQVFNREMALEFAERKKALTILSFQEQLCGLMNTLNRRNDSCEPDLSALQEVCANARNLDFIVLETSIANRWVASWTWPVPVGGLRPYYYLYECKSLTRS